MFEVIMPKAGMAMEEGTIISWLKKEGDSVRKGEDLLTIETNKITMDEPSPADGILLKILFNEDSVVPVTTVIAYIGDEGEEGKEGEESEVKVLASPAAKRIARERAIDLVTVAKNSGKSILNQNDVIQFANQIPADPVAKQATLGKQMSGARQAVAKQMARSHAEVPPSTSTIQIDATKMVALRQDINQLPDTHITINDLIVKATINTLKNFPIFNSTFEDGQLIAHDSINIAIAVGLADNLLAPVLKNTERISVFELAKQIRQQINDVKSGTLKPDTLVDATFTVSNLGMYGITHFIPLVTVPQIAILGVCAIQDMVMPGERPESVIFRKMLNLCLTYDHRVINGLDSAKFLMHLKSQLENPVQLVLPI
jgi:pyruvate dehydrogenase E2 component (dihydrolipoamide acetyltransferase)